MARVALVFPACGRRGGVERIAWEAARHLAAHHEVAVVCRTAEDLPPGVVHVPVPAGPGGVLDPLHFRRGAAKVLAGLRVDVVVGYGAECPAGDVAVVNSVDRAWLACAGPVDLAGRRLPGAVRYASPHHLVSLGLEWTYYRALRGRALVPCAAAVGADLQRLFGLDAQAMTVVENGFSPEEFSPERRARLRPEVRAELQLAEDDVALLMVANEWQRKGLGVVLRALGRLREPRLRLVLAGRRDPGALLESLGDPSLRSRVSYIGASSDVGRLHAGADVFVLPTQYEAFCLAIVEALASGLPVVTTAVPGAADALRPGETGLLLQDPQDDAALAGLLERMLDPAVRAAMSERAGPSVDDHRWDVLMARFAQVVEDRL